MIKFGEIYLVKFYPSTGKEFSKIRPALVIQMEEVSKNPLCFSFANKFTNRNSRTR